MAFALAISAMACVMASIVAAMSSLGAAMLLVEGDRTYRTYMLVAAAAASVSAAGAGAQLAALWSIS